MVDNHNSKLTEELILGGRLQISDGVPSQIMHTIQPVMEVNPKLLRTVNIVRGNRLTTTGQITAYITPTDKDFYLTYISASYIKDATCDSTTGRYDVSIVIDGATNALFAFPIITTTAQTGTFSQNFVQPIKLDKNSGITFSGTFTAGACARTISIGGYTVDNLNA